MAYRLGLSQFLCSRRFRLRNIALSLCFLCFCCVFFADILLFLLLLPPPFWLTLCHLRSSPLLSGVLLHLCCCVCHICTVLAVVPGVSHPVCFVFSCFWGRVSVVSALFLLFFSLLLPLWCWVFWLLVVCWCGVLVSWSVGCFVCVVCVWCLCSSVGSVLFWVVRCFVVLLVLVVCGCSSVCVAPPVGLLVGCRGCVALSAFLLLVVLWLLRCSGCWCVSPVRCTVLVLVAPGWFMLLLVRVLLFWWFLVVVGPFPLFLVDLGCFSFSWFFFLTFFATPACGVACVWFCLFWFYLLNMVSSTRVLRSCFSSCVGVFPLIFAFSCTIAMASSSVRGVVLHIRSSSSSRLSWFPFRRS